VGALHLRILLLIAGFSLCLVGGFLYDPHPLWGSLDKVTGARMILVLGAVITLISLASKPWAKVTMNLETNARITGLILIWVGLLLFDPRQGYSDRLSFFLDGNAGPIVFLVIGVGFLVMSTSEKAHVCVKRLGLVMIIICLLFATLYVSRITRQQAIDKCMEYFSELDGRELVGAWFGIERPHGMGRGFFTTNGKTPSTRFVWRIDIHHDSLFRCVWIAPWSGEIIAVDGPSRQTRFD
jgi:hypothetical protein